MGVRAKLFLVSLALISAVGLSSGVYLEHELRASVETQLEGELRRHAGIAREALRNATAKLEPAEIDALADRIGAASDIRITVIGRDGRVLGDSHIDLAGLSAAQNHASRPEVERALRNNVGLSRRYSTTVGTEMLYVALPLSDLAVVRAAKPLKLVDEAIGRLRLILMVAAALGLVVAVLMSALASSMVSRTLEQLVENARGLSQGDRRRIPVSSGDELGILAGSLNRMADELQHALSMLAGERDRLRTVLQGTTQAVLALDATQRLELINPAACALLGIDQDAKGRTLVEASRMTGLIEFADFAKDEAVSKEFQLEGGRVAMGWGNPLRATGGTVIVLHDITEMRRLEAVRRDFVANVSHELRTPVSVIQANAETLLDGALEDIEQATHFVEAVQRNAQRLSSLIRDLLDLARIEGGAYRMEPAEITLAAAARSAAEVLKNTAQQRKITLELPSDPGPPIRTDANALEQILVNLLDNAVKYSDEGGHVRVQSEPRGKMLRVTVMDDGPGISERHRSRVFERFYRVDPGRSRAAGGTGLGLAIVKHLVALLGGEVGVEAAPVRGAAFWFTLPLEGGRRVRAETAATGAAGAEPRTAVGGS